MQEIRNWLECNIEIFSHVFLVLGNFLVFFLCFPRVLDTNIGIQNARENLKREDQ